VKKIFIFWLKKGGQKKNAFFFFSPDQEISGEEGVYKVRSFALPWKCPRKKCLTHNETNKKQKKKMFLQIAFMSPERFFFFFVVVIKRNHSSLSPPL